VGAKSPTDKHWDLRASSVTEDAKVNMPETVQRDHELQFVFKHLWPGARMAEVGCGNGYVTQQLRLKVAHVEAFDYSEKMIERARATYGEINNRFIHDSILDPQTIKGPYDLVLCVRVLINLRDLQEQTIALRNIAKLLQPGSRLILIEGFRDGFDAINNFRVAVGLSPAIPAAHVHYSYLHELLPTLEEFFRIEERWHTGLYDFLTRVIYPQLVGAAHATAPGEFHEKIEPVVRANDQLDMGRFARFHGFLLVRR
jgi:SAM-dependent methyltransferase